MKRRTLIRKVGAAGIATAALSGSATAERPSVSDLDIDRELDVSSVEGWVPLAELLEPEEVASLPAGVSPSRPISVAATADSITVQDCCELCCTDARKACECVCCDCTFGCEDD